MEKLITRILIKHMEGAQIAYLYNRESFDLLKIDRHAYDESQFIEIGSTIEYGEDSYVVERINFKLEKTMSEGIGTVGINMYSPTVPSDFNCQLGVFVKLKSK